jgi:hypothetical protein
MGGPLRESMVEDEIHFSFVVSQFSFFISAVVVRHIDHRLLPIDGK